MRGMSVAQAQAFDRFAQEKLGVPSLILMENAGRSAAEEAIKMLKGLRGRGTKGTVAIICGAGNNGGDGLVAARHLLSAGKKVRVFLIGKVSKLKPDPEQNFSILEKMGCDIIKSEGDEEFILRFPGLIKKTDLIIDAIFGIGLSSAVRSPIFEVIEAMNKSKKPVLSVDVPSGLDADSGRVLGAAVRATRTVTFVASKKGFRKARRYCGRIVVRDIGIRHD